MGEQLAVVTTKKESGAYSRFPDRYNQTLEGYAHIVRTQKQPWTDLSYKQKVMLGIPLPYLPYYSYTFLTTDVPFAVPGSEIGSWRPLVWFTAAELNLCPVVGNIPLASLVGQADYNARVNFFSKVRKLNTFNSSVFIAESRKTVDLAITTLSKLIRSYRYVRKGKFENALTVLGISSNRSLRGINFPSIGNRKKWPKDTDSHKVRLKKLHAMTGGKRDIASSMWLEMHYAWTPLILDCYGYAEALDVLKSEPVYDITIKGTGQASSDSTLLVGPSAPNGTQAQAQVTVRYNARYQMTNTRSRVLTTLGLTNPALVVWELVPFSFCVDWFIPIGNFIENLTTMEGFTLLECCRSTKINSLVELKRPNHVNYESGQLKYTREVGNHLAPSVPIPKMNFFGINSISKFSTTLALAHTVFGKK